MRMTRCAVHQVDVDRRSSRTGQVHSIGGFVGEAEYEGELDEFLAYLRTAKWTGVGRQTVWGRAKWNCANPAPLEAGELTIAGLGRRGQRPGVEGLSETAQTRSPPGVFGWHILVYMPDRRRC
jgi:hypothetical protein